MLKAFKTYVVLCRHSLLYCIFHRVFWHATPPRCLVCFGPYKHQNVRPDRKSGSMTSGSGDFDLHFASQSRRAHNIELNGAVVIFDEAHNVVSLPYTFYSVCM